VLAGELQMWFNIIKIQAPVLRQPKIKIKTPRRENCKEKLMKIADFWEEYAEEMRDINDDESGELERSGFRQRAKNRVTVENNLEGISEETCCKFIDFVNSEVNTSGKFYRKSKPDNVGFLVYHDSQVSGKVDTMVYLGMQTYINYDSWSILMHISSDDKNFLDGFTKSIIEMIQRQFGE
jgi:hypothetical protein